MAAFHPGFGLAASVSPGHETASALRACRGLTIVQERHRRILDHGAPTVLVAAVVVSAVTIPQLSRRLSKQISLNRCRPVRPRVVLGGAATVTRMESATADVADERLRDVAVDVMDGYEHENTLIYLHGFQRYGCEYLNEGNLCFCMPWVDGPDRAPGLRAVLPTAENMDQPWGTRETSWYRYFAPNRNGVGQEATILRTRRRLRAILHDEIARLGGDGRRVFLGGSSQGCTTALDTYLQEASRLGLGGFIGNTGFIPSDGKGFPGASKALDNLIADTEQNCRPVWMQCAIDDRKDVPWRNLVEPSLRRAEGRLPGLDYRGVSGRGHGIEEWEGHYVNDFLRRYAPAAYSRERRKSV